MRSFDIDQVTTGKPVVTSRFGKRENILIGKFL
jgi:hypothetical protein